MTKYLIDTNIALRLSNTADTNHGLVLEAVATLLEQSNECFLMTQVLIEFWVVATRPVDVNGLGWTIEKTRSEIDQLLERFALVDEAPEVFSNWLGLVTEYEIMGKRAHDGRLVALMRIAQISHVLTLNSKDFSGFSDVTAIRPQYILGGRRS